MKTRRILALRLLVFTVLVTAMNNSINWIYSKIAKSNHTVGTITVTLGYSDPIAAH